VKVAAWPPIAVFLLHEMKRAGPLAMLPADDACF
jgi:hypothetical protein